MRPAHGDGREAARATPRTVAAAAVPRFASTDDALSEQHFSKVVGDSNDVQPAKRRQGDRRADKQISRRTKSRRSEDAAKAGSARFGSKWYVAGSWRHLAPIMAAMIAVAAISSGTLPPEQDRLAFGAAIGIAALTGFITRFERTKGRSRASRIAAFFVAIATPMFLFGFGIAHWAGVDSLGWPQTIAVLATLLAVTTVILRRRMFSLFGSQIACWSGVALASGLTAGGISFATGLVLAYFVHRQQQEVERRISEREQRDKRLDTRAEDILHDYEETGQGWFWETDRRGMLTYISEPVAELLGSTSAELTGKPFTGLFDLNQAAVEGERTLIFHLSARSSFQELAMRAATRGHERWWSVSGRPIYDDFNNFVGFRGSGTDLTEKKRSQEQASRLAHYDSLTGLANRLQMAQTLEKILGAPQEMQRACCVYLLDLDRFKQVNDTMGHPAGDALLKQVAMRLNRVIGEMGRVGRLGGDEFQVIVPGAIERDELGELAQEIINTLSQPYSIEGQCVVIGASVGMAIAPEHGFTAEALIRNADLALYAAKDGGRGRYHFYASDLHKHAEKRAELEQDLRNALQTGLLELHYQPVVHTTTQKITGFEALLRWNHPEKGQISPNEFIEVAEDSGLIQPIGEWALRTACAHLAEWPEEVRVAVNVSPLQFAQPEFPTIVTNAIAQAGIDPSRLELEITETVFLNDDHNTDAMFDALKRVGVRLALDDFGTGYSSLGYLKKAPFDKIKIDQSFVRGATRPSSRNGAIIAAITSLAQALGMDTTAEGVETHDELELVRMHGCSHVQGFIYSMALSHEEATARLGTGLEAIAQGPRAARSPRQKVLRRITLEHMGQVYNGTIRNISDNGVLVEGLWNVPVGTVFTLNMSDSHSLTATTRWCMDDRMGMELSASLERDRNGRIIAMAGKPPQPVPRPEEQAS